MADTPENEQASPAKSADLEIWDTIVKGLRLLGRHGFHILAGGILVTIVAIGAAKYSPFLGHVFCDVLGCRDGPPPPPPPLCVPGAPPTNPCRAAHIVVFDTAYPDEAYNHDLEANGETNAHFVVRQLRLENVDAVPAIIGRDQSTRDSFLVPGPDVVSALLR